MPFSKILIAIDDTPESTHAARYGFELAHAAKAEVALVYVVDKNKGVINADLGITPEESLYLLRQEAEKTIDLYTKMYDEAAGVNSNPEWERMHKLFHMSLLAGSPSRTLLQFCGQLHDRLNRYRSVAATGAPGPRDWKTEHDAIADAVIDRNAEMAVSLLLQHYNKTTDILRQTLAALKQPA